MCIIMMGLVGCNNPEPQVQASTQVSLCKLNQTSTIFLYPAIDYLSEEPKFFQNTTYEILKDGEYLGTFLGNRFNNSYLNVTYGNHLETVIHAKDDDCYVLGDVLQYVVSCEPTQYINPKLQCADKWWRFHAYNPNDEMDIRKSPHIKTSKDNVVVELNIRDDERFKAIGCAYDYLVINDFEIHSLPQRNVPRGITENYNIYEMFEMDDRDDFELGLVFDFNGWEKFNTTITCTLFDYEFMIYDYHIAYDIYVRSKDVGQPNPSFNFTIESTGGERP